MSLIQSASEYDYIWRQGLCWSSCEQALIQWLVPLYRKRRLGYRHTGKTTVGAQWKGSHLRTKEKSLKRNQSRQYLDLGLLTSRNMRNKFLLFKYTHSVIFYYNSPGKLLHSLQSEKKSVSLLITSLHYCSGCIASLRKRNKSLEWEVNKKLSLFAYDKIMYV